MQGHVQDSVFEARYIPRVGSALVRVVGEVDLARRRELLHVVDLVNRAPAQDVDVDLAQVTYLDSIGVAFLFPLAAAVYSKGGAIHLRAASRVADRLLQMIGWIDLYGRSRD